MPPISARSGNAVAPFPDVKLTRGKWRKTLLLAGPVGVDAERVERGGPAARLIAAPNHPPYRASALLLRCRKNKKIKSEGWVGGKKNNAQNYTVCYLVVSLSEAPLPLLSGSSVKPAPRSAVSAPQRRIDLGPRVSSFPRSPVLRRRLTPAPEARPVHGSSTAIHGPPARGSR